MRHLIYFGWMNSLRELMPYLRPTMFASWKKHSHRWHHKQIKVRWHAWNVLSWQKEFIPNVDLAWFYLGSGIFYITRNEKECLKWASAREAKCRNHTKNSQTLPLMQPTFATLSSLYQKLEKFQGSDLYPKWLYSWGWGSMGYESNNDNALHM